MILLSDGGGRIDADTQQKIRDWLERLHIGLYWIVLRQPGGLSIFDTSYVPPEDAVLPPQIELNEFFKTLNSPFHAYEADDPKSLAAAIADINQKRKNQFVTTNKFLVIIFLRPVFYSALMIGLLLSVKYLEVRTWD
jgi:mxaC protein